MSAKQLNEKHGLRKAIRGQLTSTPDAVNQLNANIVTTVNKLATPKKFWAAFQPAHHEADIRSSLEQLHLLENEILWVFPRVEGDGIIFYRPTETNGYTRSQFGILEPDPATSIKVHLSQIEGFLIPGVAFDTSGNRLGRGAGHYDRYFGQIKNQNPIKVGVGLESQLVSQTLPAEDFDIPMDWIVTEKRSFQTQKLDAPTAGRRGSVP